MEESKAIEQERTLNQIINENNDLINEIKTTSGRIFEIILGEEISINKTVEGSNSLIGILKIQNAYLGETLSYLSKIVKTL